MSANDNRKDQPARMRPVTRRRRRTPAQIREKPPSGQQNIRSSPSSKRRAIKAITPPPMRTTPWTPDNLSWLDGLKNDELGADMNKRGVMSWDSLFFLDADVAEMEEYAGDVGDEQPSAAAKPKMRDSDPGWAEVSVMNGINVDLGTLPDDPDQLMALYQNMEQKNSQKPKKIEPVDDIPADIENSLVWLQRIVGDEPAPETPKPPVDNFINELAWLNDYEAQRKPVDWSKIGVKTPQSEPNAIKPTWEMQRVVALQAHINGKHQESAVLYRQLIAENGPDCVSAVVSDLLMTTQQAPNFAPYFQLLGKAWTILGEQEKALAAYERGAKL